MLHAWVEDAGELTERMADLSTIRLERGLFSYRSLDGGEGWTELQIDPLVLAEFELALPAVGQNTHPGGIETRLEVWNNQGAATVQYGKLTW